MKTNSLLTLVGALLASLPCSASDASRLISLNSVQIDTTRADLAAAGDGASEVVLVQFPNVVTRAQRAALTAAADRVYTYLPHNAFLVRMPVAARAQRLSAVGVHWSGAYLPGYKVGRGVREVALDRTATRKRQLMLQVFPDRDINALVAKLHELGVPGVIASGRGPFFSRVRLEWNSEDIATHVDRLAALDEVFWIDLEPRRALLNDTTIWVGQSGLASSQTTPVFANGIHGEGQVVAVLDTGIDPDMCYFRDATLGLPPTNECNGGTSINSAQRKLLGVNFLWSGECAGGITSTEWDTQDHGTHVAGTVAGDNLTNVITHDAGDGMAPAAKLVIQDGGYGANSCADLPGIGCPVVDLNPVFQQTYDQGARIHSNSWGDNEEDPTQNDYSLGSQDVDEFMWNHKDFLIFFAAGNSGPGAASVGSPSTAKSAVSVGATQRATLAGNMASFSSCGPTDDGRVKPEITVPGSQIISANADNNTASLNCTTKSSSGTSMATPGAAGLTALIRQYYTHGFYPTGAAVVANALTPSAALMRATLVNSGENMTGATVMPSNCQGWGRVTLDNTLHFPADTRALWVQDDAIGFSAAAVEHTYAFNVAANEPLKLTLAWTDFPWTPAANPHLVNDLDLSIVVDGVTYRGNLWSAGQSVSGGSADRLNTLEQILLNVPTAGSATVTVRAHNIPSGPQPYALVVTGAISVDIGPLFNDSFE